jgi:gliding motility-associated-like protein
MNIWKIFLGLLLWGGAHVAQAQVFELEVMSAGGGVHSDSTYSLSWTLGEPFTELLGPSDSTSEAAFLTSGFQQALIRRCDGPIPYALRIEDVRCYGENNGSVTVEAADSLHLLLRDIISGDTLAVAFADTVTFASLPPSEYEILLEDYFFCDEQESFYIDEPADFEVDAGDDQTIRLGETTNLSAFGAWFYRWSPATGISDTTSSNPDVNPVETTTYVVAGYSDDSLCVKYDTVTVFVIDEQAVLPHKVLSPNGDNINDFWEIDNIWHYPNAQIKVFNRWGQVVFEAVNYQNDWDGSGPNGERLPIGAYYYIIEIPSANRKLSGHVNLLY